MTPKTKDTILVMVGIAFVLYGGFSLMMSYLFDMSVFGQSPDTTIAIGADISTMALGAFFIIRYFKNQRGRHA